MPKRTYTQPRSLADWRKAQDLSQQEAARILGIAQSQYSRLERNVRGVRRQTLKAIHDKTGVPVEELLGIAS